MWTKWIVTVRQMSGDYESHENTVQANDKPGYSAHLMVIGLNKSRDKDTRIVSIIDYKEVA